MVVKNKPKSNELRIIREYNAPVKAVWDAWTDPAQAAQWWGPRGFTITTHSKDLRVGGHWHYTMHGPDGVDYPNKTKYFEVEEYKKLVYDHGANDEQGPLFRVTVLFSEKQGKTLMDMRMTLPTPEAAEETRKFVKKAGGNATWDRLAEYLEKESSGTERFVINRSFCDENEALARHPMAPTWPATMLTTIEFTSEGEDQTRVTITAECHGDTTPEELATFVQARGGMTQGWTGSFDKLEEYLSTQ
ncbi:MAG: SRPBCC domain-containing protein [Candidatus Melainabacteria bacterium]|nr:SRPBCC domain-containing protein [Candidatus Melainabacteria bacterium]